MANNINKSDRTIAMAINLMFLVAEFNSIEQDIDKILLFEKYRDKYNSMEGVAYIKNLTDGSFKYSAKIDELENNLKTDSIDIDTDCFRELGRKRNNILHAIYFLDKETEEIEDEIFLKKLKVGKFSEEFKDFEIIDKDCREKIREIGNRYGLNIIDESIKL